MIPDSVTSCTTSLSTTPVMMRFLLAGSHEETGWVHLCLLLQGPPLVGSGEEGRQHCYWGPDTGSSGPGPIESLGTQVYTRPQSTGWASSCLVCHKASGHWGPNGSQFSEVIGSTVLHKIKIQTGALFFGWQPHQTKDYNHHFWLSTNYSKIITMVW